MNSRLNRINRAQIRRNPYLRTSQSKTYQNVEPFNANLQFRPFELYLLTDMTGKYAITCEGDPVKNIFLSKADDKNKNQWVFMDSDTGNGATGNDATGIIGGSTGAIAFFNPTDGYLSLNYKGDLIYVVRNHSLKDTIFEYEGKEGYIILRDKPEYCLAFKNVSNTPAETPVTPTETPSAETPAETPAAKTENFIMRSVRQAFAERFSKECYNKDTEPELMVVNKNTMNKSEYSYKWTWHKVVDLREFIRNAEIDAQNKKMLEESSNKADAQQKVIKNLELQKKTDSDYYNSIIRGYEELPGIRWFNKVSAALNGMPIPKDTPSSNSTPAKK